MPMIEKTSNYQCSNKISFSSSDFHQHFSMIEMASRPPKYYVWSFLGCGHDMSSHLSLAESQPEDPRMSLPKRHHSLLVVDVVVGDTGRARVVIGHC